MSEAAAQATRGSLGRVGEDAAARLYERLGYRVEARNLRIGRVELDLVLRRGRELVFCEVKTRRGRALGLPEEAVDARKRARLLRAAEGYLARRGPRGDVRFDVVAVSRDVTGKLELRRLENAFRPW
ncbi:MAG TPA: YraN family protein [Gemmatimonadota bacterium]